MTTRTKKPKAPWLSAFPEQAKQLRPENAKAGGVKSRSQSEAVRMAIYVPIAAMFKLLHPACECCQPIFDRPPRATQDVHHRAGRAGLLLFDVRNFKAACRHCHNFIQENPNKAKELGLLLRRCYQKSWVQKNRKTTP